MIDCVGLFFFFKRKTAYQMRISDWGSDVCSSDLRSIADDRLFVPCEGSTQLLRRRWVAIQRSKECLMICRLKDRMLVSRNHQHRSLIGGVHGKDGIVHTRKRSRLLNRFLDTRLGPERHAFSAALVHLADFVLVSLHGYLLSFGNHVGDWKSVGSG